MRIFSFPITPRFLTALCFFAGLWTFVLPSFAHATEIERIGAQLIARGCGARLGTPQFIVSRTSGDDDDRDDNDDDDRDEDDSSEWASDEDESPFDCARLSLFGTPFRRITKKLPPRKDFRLCVQLAGKPRKEGREACTPWASEGAGTDARGQWIPNGGGWSEWAEAGGKENPRRMKIRLQKRPLRASGMTIEDARIGIQLSDNGCRDIGAPKFTPWLSDGGGWTQWATDANGYAPDCARVLLESRAGYVPPPQTESAPKKTAPPVADETRPPAPPAADLWIQKKGKFYDTAITIARGEELALVWAGGDARSCSLSPSGGRARSGAQTITPQASQTYTLRCENAGGSSEDSVTVIVSDSSQGTTDSISPSPDQKKSKEQADQKPPPASPFPSAPDQSSQDTESLNAQEESGKTSSDPFSLFSESKTQSPNDAPILSQGIRGSHDGENGIALFDQCSVFGWATNTDDQTTFPTIHVYADGSLIMQILANQFRDDLRDVCPNGTCAFSANLFNHLKPYTSSVIRVRAIDPETAEEVNLANTPQKLTCTEPPAASSSEDISLANIEVCGGGVDPQQNSRCKDLNALGEYPLGICALPRRPVFSWNYSHAQGFTQNAYQIQTDDDAQFSSPIIDTGKIQGNTNSYILPAGLSWDTPYFWRLRVWDSEDTESGWAHGASFVTPPHEGPTVKFSWSPENLYAGGGAQFFDKSSVFSGGSIRARHWTFQDANPAQSSDPTPETIFTSIGKKKISLIVEDSDGFSCGLEKTAGIAFPPPPEFKEVIPR